MNFLRQTFLAFFALLFCTSLHGASLVQMTVTKNVDKVDERSDGQAGGTNASVKTASYAIKLVDAAFTDLADLTVEYIVFVERQKISTKRETDIVVREAGKIPVPLLTKKTPITVETTAVKLNKSSLIGNYIYSDGGRIKVEDSIKGVWVRVMQGGKMIAEYANPSTVMARGWEEK